MEQNNAPISIFALILNTIIPHFLSICIFDLLSSLWIQRYTTTTWSCHSFKEHHFGCVLLRKLSLFVTHFRFGDFPFFCDVKLPSLPKNIYKKKSIIRIDVAVTGTHHHNTGSLYSNLTFDLKKLNTFLLRFNKLLLFLFRFSNWTK